MGLDTISVGNVTALAMELTNVLDGWVYYTTGSGPYIFKIREDGSERTRLTEHSSSYVQVIDEWIYYLNQKHLYRINLDGKEQTLIATDVLTFPNIVDGWVYYSKKGSGIYKSKMDGSTSRKISSNYWTYSMEVTLNRKAFFIARANMPWYYSIDSKHDYPAYSGGHVVSRYEAPPVIYYIDQMDRIYQLPASENPDIIKHRSDAATRVYKMIIGDLSNQIDQFFSEVGLRTSGRNKNI